jgi:hypothetical protein
LPQNKVLENAEFSGIESEVSGDSGVGGRLKRQYSFYFATTGVLGCND